MTKNSDIENRVLVCMPTGRDGSLVSSTLGQAGIAAYSVDTCDHLFEEIKKGVGAVLIAEEALLEGAEDQLQIILGEQPVWSDLPMLVFARGSSGSGALLDGLGTKFNATVVERPIKINILLSAARSALRARQRQYQARDFLDQLKQADVQKDLFLATLSHELRTPLNSILGWIQVVNRAGYDEATVKRAMEVIERNAAAQSEMISDILFVSRVIAGKLEIDLEPVDIIAVIQSVIDVIKPSADAKSIEISFDSAGFQSVPVDGNPERMPQIFLNLLTNAIKFTPDSGQIGINVLNKENSVEIEVRDNGEGIKPEFLPHVFERFRQADSSYTRQAGGLGLGLAIVRHLVDLHGGRIRVESKGKGRGSSFFVSFPVSDAKRIQLAKPQEPEVTLDESETGKWKILLVEDDLDSREMLATVLDFNGFNTTAVESAAEAIETISAFHPDLLISDVGLPGEDGHQLLRRVRSLSESEGGNIPAIALTGYVSEQDRMQAIEAGFQEHLPKPIDVAKLIRMVSELLTPGNGSRSGVKNGR